MIATELASVLAVDLDFERSLTCGGHLDVTSAPSRRDAIELLRILRFDLVVVGWRANDPPWMFVRRMRACRPGQKWLLAACDAFAFDGCDEIAARSLGALRVIDGAEIDWQSITEIALGKRARLFHTGKEWERICVSTRFKRH